MVLGDFVREVPADGEGPSGADGQAGVAWIATPESAWSGIIVLVPVTRGEACR